MSKSAKILGCLCLAVTLNAVGSETAAMTPPKYLEIKSFQKCLSEKDMGGYTAWCMPAKRAKVCPRSSWKALKKLTGDDKMPAC